MKICVVTPLFAISGVPLAQIRFARAWAEQGHDVDLMIGHIRPQYKFPEVPGVSIIELKRYHVRDMLAPLWRYLRASKPDIVFSAEDHLNAVVLLAALAAGSRAKISCSSRVTPYDTYSNKLFSKRWILKCFMRSVMARADALTCVSKDMVDQYRTVFRSAPHVDVYNIVLDQHSPKKMLEEVNDDWFISKETPLAVAAGRLAPWKGFSDLIEAMKLLAGRKNLRLAILGDGPLKAELQKQIDDANLHHAVKLLGYVENPLKYFSKADIFVLSSHVEGLPNVLVEAMMCGCTPVATDCPTGPREVLHGGKYGYLVPVRDPSAMADAMARALDNPLPNHFLAEAIQPFAQETVLKRHFEVLGLPG